MEICKKCSRPMGDHHRCVAPGGAMGPVGLGDTIAKITSALGVKPCGRCKKRQQKLNEMFPYKDKENGK